MIETPAAAIMSDRLAKEVDFFSCGTNDLTQYTLACDRQNNDLGRFYDPHHPAVLRLLKMVADNAHKNGIWVGICGELGADLTLTETFLAIGHRRAFGQPARGAAASQRRPHDRHPRVQRPHPGVAEQRVSAHLKNTTQRPGRPCVRAFLLPIPAKLAIKKRRRCRKFGTTTVGKSRHRCYNSSGN